MKTPWLPRYIAKRYGMNHCQRSKIEKYWEKRILGWEASAYYKSHDQREHLNVWDRVSTFFRRDLMYERMEVVINPLAPHVQGWTVLDVGCGSGRFAFRLLETGASRVIGVDFAAPAIQAANQRRESSDYRHRLEFFRADVTRPGVQLPPVDLATALGVLEYFDSDALAVFLGNLRTRYFLFELPPERQRPHISIRWLFRRIYLGINRCQGTYFHTPSEFLDLASHCGFADVWLVHRSSFTFATNLVQEGT